MRCATAAAVQALWLLHCLALGQRLMHLVACYSLGACLMIGSVLQQTAAGAVLDLLLVHACTQALKVAELMRCLWQSQSVQSHEVLQMVHVLCISVKHLISALESRHACIFRPKRLIFIILNTLDACSSTTQVGLSAHASLSEFHSTGTPSQRGAGKVINK